MTAKNALILEDGKFIIREGPIPEPGPGEVVVKVAACGICGTDLNLFIGKRPRGWKISFPFQMGHELSGVIQAVGAGVPDEPGLRIGDRVVQDGRLPCGHCRYCRRGHENLCINQGYTAGGFAQYAVYPYQNLLTVPDNVDLVEAAFAEPLACCINGNNKLANVPLGGFGVVIGAGPIGLLHVQLLKSRGLQVIAIDLQENRLDVARSLGAKHVIKARKSYEADDALIDRVIELSGGFGADVVVTAAGLDPSVLEEALAMSAKQGQILYFAATLSDPVTLNLDVIHYKELALIGTHDSTRADYEKALAMMQSGNMDLSPIISHRYPLEEIYDAFDFARQRKGLKVMVVNEGF
ncbi:MAG TPA: alcohol dehydrogenase catalytic domain-containing protein [Anaerolineae bacterium]|nr:alcohol dehydrogenase catalytic domain-containing protein [Anaerolineae bacterium]